MLRHNKTSISCVGLLVMACVGLSVCLAPVDAWAQYFTIGPAGTPGFFTDIVYAGPAPPPPLTGGGPAAILFPPPPGNPPAPLGTYIVDALSSANEAGDRYYFSVDPFAAGAPGTPVAFETAVGTAPSQVFPGPPLLAGIPPEAHGDIFGAMGPALPTFGITAASPPVAFPLPTPPPGLSLMVDEFTEGLNVFAPAGPDNLNALAIRLPMAGVPGAMLYSLAAGGLGAGPFVPGDVVNGATGALYAPAPVLGLDTLGIGTDDLDALIVQDIGLIPGVYDPADFLAFSLAPGSPTIGLIGGAPGGGDLLMPVPGGLPAIFIPAAAFGLLPMDNLDAIDVVPEPSTIALALAGFALLAGCQLRRRLRR